MKRSRRVLTIGVLAALAVGVAAADTVTYTSAVFGPATTDFSAILTLPKFDPTIGTLASVKIDLGTTENITLLHVANNASIEEDNFTINGSAQIHSIANTAVAADNISAYTIIIFNTGLLTLGPVGDPSCPFNTPGPTCNDVFLLPPGLASGTGSVTDSSAAIVGYIGLGTFDITGVTNTLTTFAGGGGNIFLQQATKASMQASVTYTYGKLGTGVPEPATIFLMGSALAGVGLIRLRSKRS